MQVALVLKSGGVYTPRHVQVLARQVETWLPGAQVFCLSDVPVPDVETVPLQHGWPGWWSKMELFRPDVGGGVLYFDLDTIIRGPLNDIAAVSRLTLLRDFYRDGVYKGRAEGLGSGVMYLPEADRAEVWEAFARSPGRVMAEHARGGDQAFLERFYLSRAARWQDLVGNQIVSYKVHCRSAVPENARVVCAHGKPKLWDVAEFQHYYE